MRRLHLLLVFLTLIAVAAPLSAARALTNWYTFEGVVVDVELLSGPGVPLVGDPISGAFALQSGAEYAFPPTAESAMYAALVGLELQVGPWVGAYGNPGTSINDLWIVDRPTYDLVQVRKRELAGPPLDGLDPSELLITFRDSSASAFASNDQPDVLPPLSAFDEDERWLTLRFGPVLFGGNVIGDVTQVTLIPEPGSAVLVLVGLAVLGGARRRGACT